jgi:hypothetical protein
LLAHSVMMEVASAATRLARNCARVTMEYIPRWDAYSNREYFGASHVGGLKT